VHFDEVWSFCFKYTLLCNPVDAELLGKDMVLTVEIATLQVPGARVKSPDLDRNYNATSA